jgi:23S rRNA (guanosine2251-2'-O)-methyltransferase
MKEVHLVAVNIRSAFNVGVLFRTADSFGISKIWIAGYTPTSDHESVKKTALGAELTVPWERVVDPIECLDQLRASGVHVYALEIADHAHDLARIEPQYPCAIVVGNEVEGLSKMQMEHCDEVVMLPQVGQKESLNVGVAGSIAMWQLKGSKIE